MPFQNNPAQSSPFEITTSGKSKKVSKTGIIVGVSIAVFLILSVVAGILLVRQQQNIQEKAASCSEACPAAGHPELLQSCHPADADGTANESVCNSAGRIETCGPASTKYCCPSAGGSWTTNMSACATPTPVATATATATATAIASAGASATPTSTPVATSTGNSCNKTCGSNSNCQSGLYCYSGYCRNPLCASDSTCGCGSATPTSTATPISSTTSATTTQTTPLPIPVSGTNWATFAGIGIGMAAILVSLLLAL